MSDIPSGIDSETPAANMAEREPTLTPHDRVVANIRSAIETGDSTPLVSTLNEINMELTGIPQGHFSERDKVMLQGMVDKFINGAKVRKWDISDEIYMGDGGVSRLFLTFEKDEPGIILSGVSSQKVKDKWEQLNTQPESEE
jgi:hypothetical protein